MTTTSTITHHPTNRRSLLLVVASMRGLSFFLLLLLPWQALSKFRKSITDMACTSIRQPLNHFALPRHDIPHYNQRYCTYEFASSPNSSSPVLFYTGNESPLETYINHTGLLWQLAESMQATVVFAEHRYEGHSLPPPENPNCLAYSSSLQAIADYARLIELHYKPRPVVVFGGSYGGMLSAWMRFLYPHLVAGAIAASAPIWGLPLTTNKIDGASAIVQHGLEQAYPPTVKETQATNKHAALAPSNFCTDNLLAAWPLIQVLGESVKGRQLLTSSFALCSPMKEGDAVDLINWAQSPWFDLAEGSFPYPSSYIPFALTHDSNIRLPAWPLQAACWNASQLHQDMGIRIKGNLSDIRYQVRYGESGLVIDVDWGNATTIESDKMKTKNSDTLYTLLKSVRDAVGVWFNMTKDVQCYNLTVAPNRKSTSKSRAPMAGNQRLGSLSYATINRRELGEDSDNRTALCEHGIRAGGSWPSLVCNEEMNLIITEARGMGNDMFWPPTHPRGIRSHADVVAYNRANNLTLDDACSDPHRAFGFSNETADPWSTWLDTIYGGIRIKSHSNIVFSNGLLDPWSAAGVYVVDPFRPDFRRASFSPVPGLMIQNVSESNMIALIMEIGGHHTDLFYDDDADPASIRYARDVEATYVARWVEQWNSRNLFQYN